MRPLFSCVVAVKGKRPYFDEAMRSLLSQGMGDELEIIVQDADVEPDEGQSDAFNRGFAKAHGEWLFWLNADDVLLPGALRRVRSLIAASDAASSAAGRPSVASPRPLSWIAGNQVLIDDRGRILKCLRGNGWHDWLYREAVPHVNGPSAFFRRELFERVGGFDASLDICMDWDLWIRFMKAGARFVRIDGYLWAQRQWLGSKTQRAKRADEEASQAREVQRMLRKNDFAMTRRGDRRIRLWRTLNGNYALALLDTIVRRGRQT